ncbi:hypothetical protein ABZ772_19760 [Streptomyces griseoincarnatus]
MTDPTTDRPHLDLIASALEDWWLITDPAQPFDTRVVAQAVDARLTRSGYRITPDPGSSPMPAQRRTTCDASHDSGFTNPLDPCILRHGHDGPLHQDANGATWLLFPAPRPAAPPSRRTVAFTLFLTLACIAGGIISAIRGDWGWTVTAAIGALVLGREAADELAERRNHRRGHRR